MHFLLPDSDGFYDALPGDRVKPDDVAFVEIDTHPIALVRIEGEVLAFHALCPHQLGDLSRGILYRGQIECPAHQWRFDVRSGRSVYPEEEALCLRHYEVKEEGGMIKVRLPDRPETRRGC